MTIEIDVTYSANGFIGPMTDTVRVPEHYTIEDVETAIKVLLVDVSTAIDKHISLRHILFARPSKS